jgi:signal transduction histidine kinase
MKRIARLIGLFSILMLFFAVAMLMSQRLLQRQTLRLRDEAIARKEAQLVATVELAGIGHPPWSAEVTERLAHALDAEIQIAADPSPKTGGDPSAWQFVHQFGDAASTPPVLVALTPPPAARLLEVTRRIATILLNLALGVIVLFAGYLLWSIRAREAVEDSGSLDRDSARAGFDSLRQLASVSARQSDELERERNERLRIEEDLNIKQLLLNRALEQKIRLGQDLHDGIIQSLYATGLTLEAARPWVRTDPAAAEARIADTTKALNATIRDVRAYINGLSPDNLRRQTLAESVGVLTRDLAAGRAAEFVVSIEEPTAAELSADATTDLLQVVRESVSNGLRHGAATRVAVRLERGPDGVRLVIADNGRGFTRAGQARTGHGLANIESRVQRHGGTVAIASAPGSGTTVTCTLPLPAKRPT